MLTLKVRTLPEEQLQATTTDIRATFDEALVRIRDDLAEVVRCLEASKLESLEATLLVKQLDMLAAQLRLWTALISLHSDLPLGLIDFGPNPAAGPDQTHYPRTAEDVTS